MKERESPGREYSGAPLGTEANPTPTHMEDSGQLNTNRRREKSSSPFEQVKSTKEGRGTVRLFAGMTSMEKSKKCHSLLNDFEEANRTKVDPGTEPESEDLDWDGYSTTLEHRLAAVGITHNTRGY